MPTPASRLLLLLASMSARPLTKPEQEDLLDCLREVRYASISRMEGRIHYAGAEEIRLIFRTSREKAVLEKQLALALGASSSSST